MTDIKWPVKGRPRFRIDTGEYIVQIIGLVEHLSYGSDNNAQAQAKKWHDRYGFTTPQWHYRYLLQPLSLIDSDTGEIKDVSGTQPQLTHTYSVTSSSNGLMAKLQDIYGLEDSDTQLYAQMVGKVMKVKCKEISNTNVWDILNSNPCDSLDPTKLRQGFIHWAQDGEVSLESVMPNLKIAHTIRLAIEKAEIHRQRFIQQIENKST